MSTMSRQFILMIWISTGALANVLHDLQNTEHSLVKRQAGYNRRNLPCGTSMALSSGNTVTLQSPGYPYRYCYNCKCNWSFGSRNANDRLRLTCRDFQLENSRDCSMDYVAVETSLGYTQRFCGYSGPLNFESSGHMSIKFTSNWHYSYRGFSCSLTVVATSGSGVTTETITTKTPPVSSSPVSPLTMPQCKCGHQQGKRKKRSSDLSKWPLTTKEEEEGITYFFSEGTTGNKTEIQGGALNRLWHGMHPLRNRFTIRVVGGTDTQKHEFPWVVLITYEGRGASTCGGAVINNKYIITAGHCLLKPTPPFSPLEPGDLTISLGEHDRGTTTETTETIKKKAARIMVHPEFDSVTLFNDIGLIELQEPLDLESTSNIGPVCPPDPNNLYDDKEAVIAGWGFTKSPVVSGPSNSNILQKATLKIYSNADCQAKYTMATEQVTENMICALGSDNEDACVNDSGGPLVVKEGGSWVVVGLVSWGPSDGSCGGNDGKPGVYTRVGKYLHWIGNNINKANTCPPVGTTRQGRGYSFRNSFGIF